MLVTVAALPVHAWGPDGPAPPAVVHAEWTADGTLVSWIPSVNPFAPPVTGYTVYRLERLAPAQWMAIGTTAADATSFLDAAIPTGEVAFYYVTAQVGTESSPPSHPTSNADCPPIRLLPYVPFFEIDVGCLGANIKIHGEGG
jgi:hypothetical protein